MKALNKIRNIKAPKIKTKKALHAVKESAVKGKKMVSAIKAPTYKGKKIHPALMVLAGLATVGLIYGTYRLIKNRKEAKGVTRAGVSGSASKPSLCVNTGFPVRYGSCGDYVKPLQCYLKSLGANLGKDDVDGRFGPITKREAERLLGRSEFDRAFMQTVNSYWNQGDEKCK